MPRRAAAPPAKASKKFAYLRAMALRRPRSATWRLLLPDVAHGFASYTTLSGRRKDFFWVDLGCFQDQADESIPVQAIVSTGSRSLNRRVGGRLRGRSTPPALRLA
ncbi:MAG: hypothetical protein GY856_17475 [bacterium]|nr:hypothetical protein [bacterium]